MKNGLKKLGQEKAQALYENIVLLRNAGNTLNLPYSKSLGQGLFELKEKEFGLRVYYSFLKGKIVVLLHGGDKSTQKMTY